MNLSTFLNDDGVRTAIFGFVGIIIAFIGGMISIRTSRAKDRLKLQEAVDTLTISSNAAREKLRQELDELRLESEKARIEAEKQAEKTREDDRKFIRDQADRERERVNEIIRDHQKEREDIAQRTLLWNEEIKRRQRLYEDEVKRGDEARVALREMQDNYLKIQGAVELLTKQLEEGRATTLRLESEVNEMREALINKQEELERAEQRIKVQDQKIVDQDHKIEQQRREIDQLVSQGDAQAKELKRQAKQIKELGNKPDTGPLPKVIPATEPPTPPAIPPLSDRLKPDVP